MHPKSALITMIFGLILFQATSQNFYEPGLGIVRKSGGSFVPRINFAAHELVAGRIGLYGTFELGSKTSGVQDIFGAMFRINTHISVYGGAGVLRNGLLAEKFRVSGVRKEMGVSVNIPRTRWNADLGFSFHSVSFNVGYLIPTRKYYMNRNFNPERPSHRISWSQ